VARVSAIPRRGDVYWVALDPTLGSEIQKTRPAVILSNDSCNRYGTRVVVVPVTGNVGPTYPGEAEIELRGKRSRALGDQIRSIDKARLRGKVGRLTTHELAAIEEAVRITLDL
jgi:mRNA interferase MazF